MAIGFGMRQIANIKKVWIPADKVSLASMEAPKSQPEKSFKKLSISPIIKNYPFPDTFNVAGKKYVAQYWQDSLINRRIDVYMQRYRPEHGVIAVCDLKSGRILGLGERRDDLITHQPQMALGGRFPAASLIKILTAIAALENQAQEVTDSIPQIGAAHTLYRSQVCLLKQKHINKISLMDAFAKSVNPAFGILGLSVGSKMLRETGERMGFNQESAFPTLVPSNLIIPDSGFSLAEMACGFNQITTISPLHALEIVRGAAGNGKLQSCEWIQSLHDEGGKLENDFFENRTESLPFISTKNLPKLRGLMEATIEFGTARKSFHQILHRNQMDQLDIGGKTGSLDGQDPPGRYDWFLGYAKEKNAEEGIAICIMLVHHEYKAVKANQLAALLIRDWLIEKNKEKVIRKT